LEYSYANADLLEFPQKYQMTPFEGREFLSSYYQSRKDVLDKISQNPAVRFTFSLDQILEGSCFPFFPYRYRMWSFNEKPEYLKTFVTNDLLTTILLRLEYTKQNSPKQYEYSMELRQGPEQQETRIIMALLKKFEIKKKIFTEYDYDFSKYDSKLKENSTDFKILRNYILFAGICMQKFRPSEKYGSKGGEDNYNLKFLNVLLKLNDIICSQIDSIKDKNDLWLVHYVIARELEFVQDLNRKTL